MRKDPRMEGLEEGIGQNWKLRVVLKAWKGF